ncbi:hypothetical protein KFL_001270180 [Klebsormidium nitens]|uniref:DUF7803 domain-containing protein n=1 Tax=Klebsormidium nitens TaxID=105231 RepID=A0A1Y1I2A6_KLENI|nr:hypothetical protein KFL_001270180 [Klebsormidium nitens]|eukprot:GAQ82876.1 hypothetical protein KFL_001270180 [Klebsormidium nitens]
MVEEAIMTGDDLMVGPPAPLLPADLAPQILEGVDVCQRPLRRLYKCLYENADAEPFCQNEILLSGRCFQKRDEELRSRLLREESKLARTLPGPELERRQGDLLAAAELLQRRLILASGIDGIEGFRQRWKLNGQLTDVRSRLERLGVSSIPPPSLEAEAGS